MFTYNFEGIEIFVDVTKHARERLADRNIMLAPVYGAIVAISDKLLDLKRGEEFAIIDKDINIAIIGTITSAADVMITVITVIDSSKIWVKSGTKVVPLENRRSLS